MKKIIAVMLLLTLTFTTCPAFAETGLGGAASVEASDTAALDEGSEDTGEPAAGEPAAGEDPGVSDDPTIPTEPENPEEPLDLDQVKMSLDPATFNKTGVEIRPVPTLTYEEEPVSEDKYTLEYANNIKVGTATVTAVFENGSKSLDFTIRPAIPKAVAITKVKSSKPYVVVTWNKVTCTGYQLQFSQKSTFAGAGTYYPTTNTKSIGKLLNKKTYYFRVRPYNKENGLTTYGSWSEHSSSKVYTTGAVGNKYSQNGAYIKNKTIKISDNYYYYNSDGLKSGCSKTMWDKVKNKTSKTKYLIAVDCSKNRVCVYTGKKGSWKLKSYWKCTTGKKSTPTIKGSFKVKGKVSHFGEGNGYSVWYATRIKYEYYFHSVLYKPYSKSKYVDKRLGKNLSHGCIRLAIDNAKWIYKNCKNGTRIVIY